MISTVFSRRGANLLTALASLVLVGIAYFYMEKYLFLVPCPLCYAQRIVFLLIAFFAIIAAIFPAGRLGGKIYGIGLFLLAGSGAALSIRHLYLQSQPKDFVANCGQDFYALVANTPLAESVRTMLTGSGECGDVQWTMLGLSIPGWTLVTFIGIGFWSLFYNTFRND